MIAHNLDILRKNIIETTLSCGRKKDAVKLIAVSKRFPRSALIDAQNAGQVHFGENYIQEAQEKFIALNGNVQFHFIGHLQTNKAKIAAQIFSMIETIDSIKLARSLNKHLTKLDKTLDILIQVNWGREEQKSGIRPECVRDLLSDISECSMLRPLGLMTIPPFSEDPEDARPFFRNLHSLAESLSKEKLFYNNQAFELSMGMSNDYRIAIEEGATMIRIGTAIFGQRTLKQ